MEAEGKRTAELGISRVEGALGSARTGAGSAAGTGSSRGADSAPVVTFEALPSVADLERTPLSKRALDVTVALIQLLLTAPLWVLIPLAIKLEDGGPVFFRQERVGKGGEPFTSYKFRSMAPRQDEDGPSRQAELEEHRVTRMGKLLRPTALDELPQLWNILKGEMSFVGPRALVPEEREAARGGATVRLSELPGYEERHAVVPGLTGLAQVRAPRDLPHRDKFRYDLVYVRRRNFWLDLKLILLSFWISVRGEWPEVGKGQD